MGFSRTRQPRSGPGKVQRLSALHGVIPDTSPTYNILAILPQAVKWLSWLHAFDENSITGCVG